MSVQQRGPGEGSSAIGTGPALSRMEEKKMRKYDPQCKALADAFLSEFPRTHSIHIDRLAQRLQDEIEDFIAQENLNDEDDYDPVREHGLSQRQLGASR